MRVLMKVHTPPTVLSKGSNTSLIWTTGRTYKGRNNKLSCIIHAAAKSLQSCLTLCDPLDGSPPGSPVPGILQVRTLEWVSISFSKRESEVAQSCPTLRDPMDCSLPGSSIHGIFQARVLEWGAIAFSCIIHTLLF